MVDVQKTIRDMARLSLLSNKINEIQEKNLKIYGFAFFYGVSEAKIDYDFSNKALVDTEEDKKNFELKYKLGELDTSHFRISYYLTIDEKTENSHLDKRFSALEQAVRHLFWKGIRVEVFFNDKKVFESK